MIGIKIVVAAMLTISVDHCHYIVYIKKRFFDENNNNIEKMFTDIVKK